MSVAIACLSSWACAAEVVYDISDVSRKPAYAGNERPIAPAKTIKKGEPATAELQFVVRANKTVSDVKVVSSSDEPWAKECVRKIAKWTAIPAKKDGKNVDCRMTLTFKFDPSLVGSNKVFDISEVDAVPFAPNGPGRVQTRGTKGSITAVFVVNAKGRVEDLKIVEASSDEASTLGRLMILGTDYRPATKDGVAVKCRLQQPVAWFTESK